LSYARFLGRSRREF